MQDCKTCKHATILYRREKDDRFSNAYSPIGYILCKGPRYKGRSYFRRDDRRACGEYGQKGRKEE